VQDLGFTTPSDIQSAAVPALLSGRDITGVAQTGTGKTAAFGLPLLAAVDPEQRSVQALVLTPTRELALQVSEAIASFATHLDGLDVLAVYGGSPYQPQIRALAQGAQVVVGTPGRVMDHLAKGTMDLADVRFLVLDEADEMLRMGFAEDVDTIFAQAPAERQVALFSATMPPAIRRVASEHLNDPVSIAVARQSSTVTAVEQQYAIVPFRHKLGALVRVLAVSDAEAAIVFCRTRGAAEDVGSTLVSRGISAATISGDVAQKDREKIVERLRSGALDVLVATDVAARGLDVERIGLVVNFDLPQEAEAYVHRIGRTGRAGRTGVAMSFVSPHERSKLRHIERTIKTQLVETPIPSPADVSAHRSRRLLARVEARVEAGRLGMYEGLVREFLDSARTDDEQLDPVTVLAAVVAMGVGDDGPSPRRDAEEAEHEELTTAQRPPRRPARDDVDRPTREYRGRDERPVRSGGRPGRPVPHDGDDQSAPRGRGVRRPAAGTRYRLSVGSEHGAQARGIVGALTNEGGLTGQDVGKIDIFPSFSLVDISAPLDDAMFSRISRARVAGKQLRIRVDEGPRQHGGNPGGKRPKRY